VRRATALAGALAMGLAGCGGSGGGGGGEKPAGNPLAQSTKATLAAGPARLDFALSAGGANEHATGILDAGHSAVAMTVTGASSGRIVIAHDKLYVKLPRSQRALLKGKAWATIDLAKAAKSANGDLGQLSGSLDPTNQLDELRAVGEVKRVGSDTIRGTATTHYHAVVDLEKALLLKPPRVRARLRKSIDELERQTNSSKLPIDAWIDSQKRLRRMTADFAHIGSMRMDLYDYGSDVRVAVPPAGQTTDITAQATG
jgi:hypothetical protein